MSLPMEIKSVAAGLIERLTDEEYTSKGMTIDEILKFMGCFGKTPEGDALAALEKKCCADKNGTVKADIADKILLEFIKDPELLLTLETEAKILDRKNEVKDVVHHAEDFRYMLTQLGEPIPERYIQHFLKEALALHRSDDEFNVCSFMEFLVATVPIETETTKKNEKR